TSHARSASEADVDDAGTDADADAGGDTGDSAPFPAVSQGRRRDEYSADRTGRRRSGRHTPDPTEPIRLSRSGSKSKLNRHSAPQSPRLDERTSGSRRRFISPEPGSGIPNGYERPRSADSIDDAVESYLCSPRLSQKIRHPQTGRVIS